MRTFPFKMAAVDIDGTLVGPDKRISPSNRAAIRRLTDLGCRVVLASGRRHSDMLQFHRDLGLDGFMVSCQGAVARHAATGEALFHAPLPAQDTTDLVAEGLRRGFTVMHWSGRGIFTQKRTRWVEQYIEDTRGDTVNEVDLRGMDHEPADKIIWGTDPSEIQTLAPEMMRLHGTRMQVVVTEDWALEFTAHNASKGTAAAAVARRHGVEQREVLAFGDGNNDIPMLTWAGLGMAMGHARPAAQAAADLVAPAGDPSTSLARGIAGILTAAGIGMGEAWELIAAAA